MVPAVTITVTNSSALFRLHRQLPFGPSYVADINQFSPVLTRVQDGLPPIPQFDLATLANNPIGSFNAVPANYKTGYAQQFNFGVERELARLNTVVKAAYVGNLARQVDSSYNINTPDPGPGTPASRKPLRNIAPGIVNLTWGDTTGDANYPLIPIHVGAAFLAGTGAAWSFAFHRQFRGESFTSSITRSSISRTRRLATRRRLNFVAVGTPRDIQFSLRLTF